MATQWATVVDGVVRSANGLFLPFCLFFLAQRSMPAIPEGGGVTRHPIDYHNVLLVRVSPHESSVMLLGFAFHAFFALAVGSVGVGRVIIDDVKSPFFV
ncbi:hypothetical protein HOY80DRAFT_944685 [Tuber brumale]|nr:hypothetical protein HOY80DRAFT_944685 [Tuber brumale]